MRVRHVLDLKPAEIVKDVEKLKVLFDFYKARYPGGDFWIINTTPHDIRVGREIVKKAVSQVCSIFTGVPVYVPVEKANGIKFVAVDYVPLFKEYRDNIVKALEEVNTYALGSIITIDAFKSLRVVGLSKGIGGKRRSGISMDTFIVAKEVYL